MPRFRLGLLPITLAILALFCIYDLHRINTENAEYIEQRIQQLASPPSVDREILCKQERGNSTDHATGDQQKKPLNPTQQRYCNEECTRKKEMFQTVNCFGLMEGNKLNQQNAGQYLRYHPKLAQPDSSVAQRTSDCEEYKQTHFFPEYPRSDEEKEFPIAYSIVTHRDAFQLEKLIQGIYWPQNWYCIHVDQKAPKYLVQTVENLAKCLPRVVVPAQRENVVYGSMSRLKADLNCMEELLRHNRTWQYIINLTGQEYPLKTNEEIVKILKIYNGANDIEGVSKEMTSRFGPRFQFHWSLTTGSRPALVKDKTKKKPPPPGNITLIKGSAFGVFSRAFIDFVFTDELVQEFLLWVSDTWSPDEIFWSTLNARFVNPMLKSPGGYDAVPERKPWLAKYVSWPPRDECHGKNVHAICIFSYRDLPNLMGQKHLFANKFYIDFDYIVLDCLEQWIYNKTYYKTLPSDYGTYFNLPFINKT